MKAKGWQEFVSFRLCFADEKQSIMQCNKKFGEINTQWSAELMYASIKLELKNKNLKIHIPGNGKKF